NHGWVSCLDIDTENDQHYHWGKATRCAGVEGQYWRISPRANGYFRLTTLYGGQRMCLDVFDRGQPYSDNTRLTPCSNFSGQLWRITGGPIASRVGDPASVRFTTKRRGSGRCLQAGDHYHYWAYLDPCQANDPRQNWYLRRTNLEVYLH